LTAASASLPFGEIDIGIHSRTRVTTLTPDQIRDRAAWLGLSHPSDTVIALVTWADVAQMC
jgi:hypothetical protein